MPGKVALVTFQLPLGTGPAAPTLDETGTYALLHASVLDAQRSRTLDRIVIVTRSPAQLIVLDPTTRAQVSVPLPRAPKQLLLGASGRTAVVAYEGWLAYYQLDPLALALERSVELHTPVGELGIDDGDIVYVHEGLSINLRSGERMESGENTTALAGFGTYVPEQRAFYYPDASRYARVEARAGTLGSLTSFNANLDFDPCWKWWITGSDAARELHEPARAHATHVPTRIERARHDRQVRVLLRGRKPGLRDRTSRDGAQHATAVRPGARTCLAVNARPWGMYWPDRR